MSSEKMYPLSTNQQQIWLDQIVHPDVAFYHIGLSIRIEGAFEPRLFEKALQHVVSSNEALRAILQHGDPLPSQTYPDTVVFQIDTLDFSEKTEPHAEAANWMTAQLGIPLTFIGDVLFKFALIKISDTCYYWFQKYHHIIVDGWSYFLVSKQAFSAYNALLSDKPVEEKPTLSYADFVNDDQKYLASPQFEKDARYWLEQYNDLPANILPPRYANLFTGNVTRGHSSSLWLKRSFFNQMTAFADAHDVSVFHMIMALLYVYFMRVSGEKDVAIGVAVSNRNANKFHQAIGMMSNVIPVRLQFDDDVSVIELMQFIRNQLLESYRHARFPLGEINKKIRIHREDRKQVFDMTVSYLMHDYLFPANGYSLEPRLLPSGGFGQSALGVFVCDFHRDQDVTINFEYRPEAFEDAEIERLKTHIECLLQDILKSAEIPIRDLNIVPPAEAFKIVHEFNHPAPKLPDEKTVMHLFEEQVARHPHNIAVIFEKKELTYRELHHNANQVAHCLRDRSIAHEERIGVFVSRSEWFVICVLGILQAGGAYLPIDPSYPPDRIRHILHDSGCRLLLTETEQRHLLSQIEGRFDVIDVRDIRRKEAELLPISSRPEHLAYVIYTSGSTGQPKGVMLEHRGLVNMVLEQISLFGVHTKDRILQFASCGFDAAMSEIFKALCSGAALVCIREECREPEQLIQTIQRHNVTVATLPPGLLRLVKFERLRRLRVLISAGEEAISEQGEFIDDDHHYWNAYGPTENSVCSTCFRVPAESHGSERLRHGSIPIGKPIGNTQVLILNPSSDQLQPIGVTGEICLAGVGLARGYLNNPELTNQKFVAHPYRKGERIYRTGDLGRWLPDGNIEFLGRKDAQVKIRGYRIELHEIETALVRHQAVRKSLVIARQDASGNKSLTAYIIPEDAQNAPTTTALSNFLKNTLPEYMIPAYFIMVASIPMTPHGKIDLRSLPSPGSERPDLDRDYLAPRTKLERFLAELWQDILHIEQIGIHDNFFELGGDSLKAATLFARLQEQFSAYIYVVLIFDAPTISQMAAYLGQHYPDMVLQRFDRESLPVAAAAPNPNRRPNRIDQRAISEVRNTLLHASPQSNAQKSGIKNRPAIFILSPPRSGSTLLRVMLAGHPSLFAPPELELLSFSTLAERKAALDGKFGFWLEGTIRAIMEIRQCHLDQARKIMEDCEHQDMSVKDFYNLMQTWLGEKMLVDKTPSYSLNSDILKRAETDFDNPVYIHLLRHPLGVIRSFVQAKTNQVFFRAAHRFSPQELAELIFIISHQNILEFLEHIPASRQYCMTFEDVVTTPQAALEGVCQFLKLEFHPDMLQPYHDGHAKMTDGIHPLSKMLGDVKFHEHQRIEASMADAWKTEYHENMLGDLAWDVARKLGYEPESNPLPRLPLVSIRPEGKRVPIICVHPGDGNILLYHELARQLGAEQPFYGLQALGLDAQTSPLTSFEEMAEQYLCAVQRAFPNSPYLLAGFCAGGIIAHEMAQQLLSKGTPARNLVILDSFTPRMYGQYGYLKDETTRFMTFLRYFGVFLNADLYRIYCEFRGIQMEQRHEIIYTDLQQFSNSERLKMLCECLQQSGNISGQIGTEYVTRAYNVYMGITSGIQRYAVRPYHGPAAVFRAQEAHDPKMHISDSSLGWQAYYSNLEVHDIPGNHFTMLKQPHVRTLANKLRQCLDKNDHEIF